MLKQLAFSTVLLMSGAAFAQTPAPAPAPAAAPGATMAPPTTTPGPNTAGAMAHPTGAMASTTGTTKLSAGDKKFVDKIASANAAEIQAAQIALQKSSDQHIKDTAQQMLTDHQDAGTKLTALAQQKGIEVPTELSSTDQKEIDTFNKLDGKKFDKTFVKDEIKDHKAALALLKKESTSGKDPDLKSFADSVTPAIQKHLDMLESKGS